MLDLIAAHPTSNSPRCESRDLCAEVVARASLTPLDRREMYRLLETYFTNTSFAQFEQDLAEKDVVILLREPFESSVVGFSTLMTIRARVAGRNVAGFFSGDTIIAREYWGSSLLGRAWLKTVFEETDRMHGFAPETLTYWFLISSGYKTWRYLPIFFRQYLPHPEENAAAFDNAVLRALATQKFGRQYDQRKGIVHLDRANPLRSGVADITDQRLRDPMVEFFVRMNPGHAEGDELACIAPISRSNLTRAGIRLLSAGVGS